MEFDSAVNASGIPSPANGACLNGIDSAVNASGLPSSSINAGWLNGID